GGRTPWIGTMERGDPWPGRRKPNRAAATVDHARVTDRAPARGRGCRHPIAARPLPARAPRRLSLLGGGRRAGRRAPSRGGRVGGGGGRRRLPPARGGGGGPCARGFRPGGAGGRAPAGPAAGAGREVRSWRRPEIPEPRPG